MFYSHFSDFGQTTQEVSRLFRVLSPVNVHNYLKRTLGLAPTLDQLRTENVSMDATCQQHSLDILNHLSKMPAL